MKVHDASKGEVILTQQLSESFLILGVLAVPATGQEDLILHVHGFEHAFLIEVTLGFEPQSQVFFGVRHDGSTFQLWMDQLAGTLIFRVAMNNPKASNAGSKLNMASLEAQVEPGLLLEDGLEVFGIHVREGLFDLATGAMKGEKLDGVGVARVQGDLEGV